MTGPHDFIPIPGSYDRDNRWRAYSKINAIEICRNDFINYGENSEAIMRIDLLPDFVDPPFPTSSIPKHDCKVIDATAGKIWKLEAYVSDQDLGGGVTR